MNALTVAKPSLSILAAMLTAAGFVARADAQARALDGKGSRTWSVDSRPLFDTGLRTSNDSSLLLRPRGAARLPDGRVVVADDGAKNIKFFSGSGDFVRSIGRQGEGPGEYQLAILVGMCGTDNVHIYDGAAQRLTTIGRDGKLVRTRLLLVDEPARKVPQTVACSPRKELVILTQPLGPIPEGDVPFRSEVEVRSLPLEGAPSRIVAKVMGSERHRFGNNAGPRPLGKRTLLAVGSQHIFIGTGDEPAIQVYTHGGTRLPDIALPFRRERITKESISGYIDRLIAMNPSRAPAKIKDDYSTVDYPEFFPLHGEMLVDATNRLWIEQYRQPGEDRSRWLVFDSNGRYEAETVLPAGFRLMEAGADYVLGTIADEDDVLRVRMLGLSRTTSK